MDLWAVSSKTIPANRRCQQNGGLGPFVQQLAMFSLVPIITDMSRNMLNTYHQDWRVKQVTSSAYQVTCKWSVCPRQRGQGIRKRRKHCPQPSQKGGIGPLAMAGMALASVLLQPLLSCLRHLKRYKKATCFALTHQTVVPPLHAWQ